MTSNEEKDEPGTMSPQENVSTTLREIAELARQYAVLSTVGHRLSKPVLEEAFRRTRKDGAPGVDAVGAQEYEANLSENLENLLTRVKSKRYRAPAVKRAWIPKDDGTKRPLGIPTIEDKILQRAVVMLLEPVYEQTFLDCSYGFRPGRSAHMALQALKEGFHTKRVKWVIDADLKDFFGSVNHALLRELVQSRVNDGTIIRLIGKWLNAGVMEKGNISFPEQGTPQGGVISPLLGNIFLHYVLDEWFAKEVQPRMQGGSVLVRYADDFVIGFEHQEDALRVLEVLRKRLAKYGLQLHESKTHLVKFKDPREDDDEKPGTFDFLGFTHYRRRSPRTGRWYMSRRTSRGRQIRGLKRAWQWCQQVRHMSLQAQRKDLARKLVGYYNYYNLWDNHTRVLSFLWWVRRAWRYWLNRRGGKPMTWARFSSLSQNVLALPTPPQRRVATCHA